MQLFLSDGGRVVPPSNYVILLSGLAILATRQQGFSTEEDRYYNLTN